MKLRCRQCGTEHKATARHFPIMLEGIREIFSGKGKKRVFLGTEPAAVGYLCWKCSRGHGRRISRKRHSEQFRSSRVASGTLGKKCGGGKTGMFQAIRNLFGRREDR